MHAYVYILMVSINLQRHFLIHLIIHFIGSYFISHLINIIDYFFYFFAVLLGIQPPENVKSQRRLAVLWPRPCWSCLQSGCRPARRAA